MHDIIRLTGILHPASGSGSARRELAGQLGEERLHGLPRHDVDRLDVEAKAQILSRLFDRKPPSAPCNPACEAPAPVPDTLFHDQDILHIAIGRGRPWWSRPPSSQAERSRPCPIRPTSRRPRVPAFDALKVQQRRTGHHDYATLDHNGIFGFRPRVTNVMFAHGVSGHNLQQSPAVGRAVAELIVYGAFRTPDLSPFGSARIARNEPFLEAAVTSLGRQAGLRKALFGTMRHALGRAPSATVAVHGSNRRLVRF